ncbi:hypothetical protein J132_03311 [Termitomyces sp. J132]|nr:hypothetical protein J132_03311 [Termitomyces sp. J132]
MSSKAVPTAPHKMPLVKVGYPQVVIMTSPHSAPAPHCMPSLKHAVKCDMNQVILTILQHPIFAQAVIGTCNTAKAFPGSWDQLAGYCFTDQVDFPLITNQASLADVLSDILPLLNHQAANDSLTVKAFFSFSNAIIQIENNCHEAQCQQELEAKQCCEHKDCNAEMLASCLNILAHCFNTLTLFLSSSQSKLNRKPKPQKVKVASLVANYKTGSKAALLLLGQVNAVLEVISLADGMCLSPAKTLRSNMHKFITTCLTHLDKVLASADMDLAGSLLNPLNISFEAVPKESDAKLANPPKSESKDPMALLSATAV